MATETFSRAAATFQPFSKRDFGDGALQVAWASETLTTGALNDVHQMCKVPRDARILAVYYKIADLDSNGVPTRVMKIRANGGGGGDLVTGLGPAVVAGTWDNMDPEAVLTADATIEIVDTTAAATHANGIATVVVLYVIA